jgi:energy-coupling factor transporter ATP-binding protein EcfA2
MRPPLLLLDEPNAYLDPAASQKLVAIVKNLHTNYGYSFVIVTHDMDLAAVLATRVVVMQQGHIVADGLPREILTDTALLQTARLEAPILTRLFASISEELGSHDIPLTVREARELLAIWQKPRG